ETEYLGLEEIDFDEDIPIVGDIFPADDIDSDVIVEENELYEHGENDNDENIDFEIPTIVSVDEEGVENVKEESFDEDTTSTDEAKKKYPKRARKTKPNDTTVHQPTEHVNNIRRQQQQQDFDLSNL
uniref:Uncharacterized protein n=1 Tax=Clytia hemisphaerica TaxID=252671 RepID=A0A7M5VA38_9CNID